jgi:hypothetical protein
MSPSPTGLWLELKENSTWTLGRVSLIRQLAKMQVNAERKPRTMKGNSTYMTLALSVCDLANTS